MHARRVIFVHMPCQGVYDPGKEVAFAVFANSRVCDQDGLLP
jgi:hypothetical protein